MLRRITFYLDCPIMKHLQFSLYEGNLKLTVIWNTKMFVKASQACRTMGRSSWSRSSIYLCTAYSSSFSLGSTRWIYIWWLFKHDGNDFNTYPFVLIHFKFFFNSQLYSKTLHETEKNNENQKSIVKYR